MSCAAIFAATLVPGSAQENTPDAEDEPDVYAAVIELRDENGEYDGYYCPPNLDENSICLGASILIQKGSIQRFLGKAPLPTDPRFKSAESADVWGEYTRFRFIGGHAMIRLRGGRYLVILEPTDEGHVFLQWRSSYRQGRPCFPSTLLDHYGDRLQLNLRDENEDGLRCVKN